MVNVATLLFLHFIVNSMGTALLESMQELSYNDIIININKGYALRRIGAYSPNVVEQIIHTFVPLSSFCLASPKTDVCLYTSLPAKTNAAELATIMTSHHTIRTQSSHTSNSVSTLIGKDLSRVLTQHHPDEIIANAKSIVHFIDNQFYYHKGDEKTLTTGPITNTIDNYSPISRHRSTSAETILKQINSNKIDFDYLSDTDLKLFLTATFSTIDTSYTISDIQESLNVFTELVISQSIFALRYCSLNQHKSLPSQPCLAVSTLFLSIPPHSESTFTVYRLIPLPIVFNADKYIYSNLPKVIGINSIDQKLIIWNDNFDTSSCIFSPIVLCQNKHVPISLLKLSCLSQLLDDKQLATSMCEVSQSQNIEEDVMYIDDGIWFFYNIRQIRYCQVFSTLNGLIETFLINEATIVRTPCDKTVTCTDVQLPALPCKQRQVVVTPNLNLNIRNLPRFTIPIKNMTHTLVSTYKLQLDKSMNNLMKSFTSKKSKFEKMMHDFATYILSVVCFIFFLIFLYIIKFIRYRLQREINNLESLVQDMISV